MTRLPRFSLLVASCTLPALTAWAATTHYVWQDSPNPGPPFSGWSTAAHTVQDAVDAAQRGDTVFVTNGVYTTGGRAVGTNLLVNRVAVDRPITLQSINGPQATVIQGYQIPGTVTGDGAVRCVYLTNGAVLSGFTLRSGATRRVGNYPREDSGGGLYCESRGVSVSNCVLLGNSAYTYGGGVYRGTLGNTILSRNSASQGGGAFYSILYDCSLEDNEAGSRGGGASYSTLTNCVLTGNQADDYGGGADESTLSACTVSDNYAWEGGAGVRAGAAYACIFSDNWSSYGGGAFQATLYNCILYHNVAYFGGGGAAWTSLYQCTVVENTGDYALTSYPGGGVCDSMLTNCIVYYNIAVSNPNYDSSTLSYCCTTPRPPVGLGNITNEPAFVDPASGDYHLRPDSPCINAGNNTYVTTTTDLDGNPRIVSGTVDIGAYEYQGPGSAISYVWLQQYGLPTDGSVDLTDSDGDLMTTWQEWQADTNPTNGASVLRLTILPDTPPVAVTFSSSAARLYTLLSCTNLVTAPPGPVWTAVPGRTDIPGNGDVLTLTDQNPTAPAFYRVSVRLP